MPITIERHGNSVYKEINGKKIEITDPDEKAFYINEMNKIDEGHGDGKQVSPNNDDEQIAVRRGSKADTQARWRQGHTNYHPTTCKCGKCD